MSTLGSPDMLDDVDTVLDLTDDAQERQQIIERTMAIVQGHYKAGAEGVSIAFVPEFTNAEQYANNVQHLSLETLKRIEGMLIGKRLPNY